MSAFVKQNFCLCAEYASPNSAHLGHPNDLRVCSGLSPEMPVDIGREAITESAP